MRCICCDNNEWENVDRYRFKQFNDAQKKKPVGMSICKSCGFVSYPNKYKTEKEINEYYRNDYRGKPPGAGNLFTSERKLGFHEVFLGEILEKWHKEGRKDLTMVDVGCAIGMVPAWWRGIFKDADVYGVELTKTFRRVAWHNFGVETYEDIKDKKHDLIMSYKVAEHQMDADKKLRKYTEHLKTDGYMYVSVPLWFEKMSNFGAGGFDLEYYYHEDHINVWTEAHFERILAKAGLEVVKKDKMIYDTTYLCKRNDELMKKMTDEFDLPSIENVKGIMEKIKLAAEKIQLRDCEGAVTVFPSFPMAWQGLYELKRHELAEQGWEAVEAFWRKALEVCGGDIDLGGSWADILMRHDKFEQAIEVYRNIRRLRPRAPSTFIGEAQCYRELAKRTSSENKKLDYITKARELMDNLRQMSLQVFSEATDWSFADSSQIPTPQEIEL